MIDKRRRQANRSGQRWLRGQIFALLNAQADALTIENLCRRAVSKASWENGFTCIRAVHILFNVPAKCGPQLSRGPAPASKAKPFKPPRAIRAAFSLLLEVGSPTLAPQAGAFFILEPPWDLEQ